MSYNTFEQLRNVSFDEEWKTFRLKEPGTLDEISDQVESVLEVLNYSARRRKDPSQGGQFFRQQGNSRALVVEYVISRDFEEDIGIEPSEGVREIRARDILIPENQLKLIYSALSNI